MNTVIKPANVDDETGNDDRMVHVYCTVCSPNATKAICGKPLSGRDCNDDDIDCVVCARMEQSPCPTCGDV